MSLSSGHLAGVRKRRRPAVVCVECRRRKIACDRKMPCGQCVQFNAYCVYSTSDSPPQRPSTTKVVPPAAALTTSPARLNATPTELKSPVEPNDPVPEPSAAAAAAAPSLPVRGPGPSAFMKSRLIGQSHWMNSLDQFYEINKLSVEAHSDRTSHIYFLLDKCKRVVQIIKAQRPAIPPINGDLARYGPPQEVAHRLVDLYLRTFEHAFRVLHIPTFQQEYRQYWNDPAAASDAFVVKLLLIMAIGSCFYHDPDELETPLHTSASQWIGVAQSWLSTPSEKHRLTTTGLQIQCLVLLARQANIIGGDVSWISAGSVLRSAMNMGLHRDPSLFLQIPVLQAELRRRLWATILEIVVQSSLDSGMPPLLSADDYDCKPPSNLDDAQLDETTKVAPTPRPLQIFTQSSVQCALMRSLPLRLRVARALNDLHTNLSYEDALRLDAELTDACRANSLLFQSIKDTTSPSPQQRQQAGPGSCLIKLVDLLVRRFLLAFHTPYAKQWKSNIAYYFSRRVCLDSALLLLSFTVPPSSNDPLGYDNDYPRLQIFGRGLFKCIMLQATATVCVEMITELHEDSSPSTSSLSRKELYQAVQDAVVLTRRRVQAGETNFKSHAFFACALGQIDAMQSGTSIEQGILEAAYKSLESCYQMLEARVATTPGVLPLLTNTIESRHNLRPPDVTDPFNDFSDLTMNSDGSNIWLFPGWYDSSDSWL